MTERLSRKAALAGLVPALAELTDALAALPGVGPKTAQRMAFGLLQEDRTAAQRLGRALLTASERVGHCQACNTFSETEHCGVCADPERLASQVCVVESPADLLVMEQTQSYRGHYFVLMGRLSPLDGLGPKEIHLARLIRRVARPEVQEVIVATNFTPEGEATAHAIETVLRAQQLVPPRRLSRLARGVPVGGELEYVDLGTIAQAFRDRRGLGAAASDQTPRPPNPLETAT